MKKGDSERDEKKNGANLLINNRPKEIDIRFHTPIHLEILVKSIEIDIESQPI